MLYPSSRSLLLLPIVHSNIDAIASKILLCSKKRVNATKIVYSHSQTHSCPAGRSSGNQLGSISI